MKKDIEKISKWLKGYLEESGCGGYVIGASGGVDSSVSICLALKAVRKDNIIAMSMPCYSSKDSQIDAKQLTDNLGIDLVVNSIENIYDLTLKNLGWNKKDENYNLMQGNLKARLRMVQLFAVANKMNYLVCGTGNLSELKIGYGTFAGDLAVSIEPLGNYYKTEVYKIAALMPEIPKNIIEKPASADLCENQTDEKDLGIKYEALDKILKALEEKNSKELDKFNIDDIEKVQNMIKKAEYKNKMPPKHERE
jgi:NAD+ synthase